MYAMRSCTTTTIIRKLDFSNIYKSISLHQSLQIAELAAPRYG